jgi:hypothetical protein
MLQQLTQALGFSQPTHAAAKTASFNSASVDLAKFRRAFVIVDVGAVSGTSPTLDAKWQESPDNSTFTDLAGTGVSVTQITTGNKTVTLEVRADQLSAGKRYARVAFTIGGTSPSFTLSVIVLGGDAAQRPANLANHADITEQKVVA